MTIATQTRAAVPTRHRAAAVLLVVTAVGVIVGSLLAASALHAYQLVLNIVGALLIGGIAMLLLRGDGRARLWSVLAAWVAALGITAESGDYQARMNDTGQLGSKNTEYFLPGIVWIIIFVLLAVAVATMMLTKRVRGS